jgi:Secretion system C-terminal sorting domain/Calx-beta domain
MKKITQKLMFFFLLFLASLGYSQKVAVIGMNHATPDGFSFLVTQDLANGEVIYFTENEYSDALNAFVDATESVVVFTANSAIAKGNVVFVNELTTANTFSVSCTGGGCGTAVLSGIGPFATATDGDSIYAYTDSDANPANGITTIYSVMYTGSGEAIPVVNGGTIPTNENPIFDFPNAIVVDGFPAVIPGRVEFNPTTPARTNVLKVGLENPSNYVHAQANAALSTLFFTNFSLLGANPTLSITASPASANENSGTGMVYTFTLSANATSNLTINYTVGGSAVFSSDYTQSGAASFNATSGTVTIPSGSSSASITLTPVGDGTLEANEAITLTLSTGTGYDVGSPGAASTTIVNDDTLTITPVVAICGINHSATQDGFSFVALQTIAAGTVLYFTENPFDKSTLTFSGAEGVMQWTAPAGGLARGQVVVASETSPNIFTTTCSGGTCGSVSLVSGTFTFASTGEELYAYLDADSNHANGVTSVQAVLYTGTSVTSGGVIPTIQDPGTVYPGAVVVDGFPATAPLRTEYNPALRGVTVDRANFQNPSNWVNGQSNITLSTTPFANIIISTGVANPFATVTVSPSSVLENSGSSMVYTFALSSPATSNITINFTVTGTATFTSDYTASGASSFTASTGSVVILNGASSATVTVTPVGDTTLEVQESIVLTITTGTGYDGGSPNAATGNINNDDTSSSQPLVALTGIAHVDPDGLSFAAAQDIPANSVIYFTDNSFNNNTLLFTSGEAVLRWTSPATIITKGNVVVITESSPDVFTVTCSNGTCGSISLISGNLALATTGETLYAYRDTDTDPSNGVADIYSVIYTGNSTVSGGNIPAIEDPSNIFLKTLVVHGFPVTAPARTEYNPSLRNVLVTAANFENISNWINGQTPPALSTVPFANLNIVDNTPPNAICQNISVTPNVGTGSVTITPAQINNNSTDNVGIASYSLNITTFTCANIGTPVTVTLTVTDTSGNTATCNATVTVLPNAVAIFNQVAPICSGGSFTLPTTSTNGTTGTWSPAINNLATTTYTFTPNAGQCGSSTIMTVVVNPSVTPTFTAVTPICAGGSLSALPTTSNNNITGTWSPALNNAATTSYTFTPDAGQCATTASLTITVNPIVTPTFTGVAAICSGGSLSALPTTSNNGITGTWSPALNNAATTTYTFIPDAGQCATSTTVTITVNPSNVTPAFTAVAAICLGGSLSALPTTSSNGITGTWSPALNNAATTTYTFTPDAGQCATTTTLTITVNPNVTPTFTAVAPICAGGSLSALPTTSNNGITGTWSPALNNTATTTYTFIPDAGLCASTATLTITVNPLAAVVIQPANQTICSGGTISTIQVTDSNSLTIGNFETGNLSSWTITSSNPTPVVNSNSPHSGSFAVALGTYGGGEVPGDSAVLSQTFTVPANGGTMSYWYKPTTTDGIFWDWQDVYITDTSGNVLTTVMHICSNSNTYTQVNYDMVAFAGQSVKVKFLVHGDNAGDPTTMYVDDVSFTPNLNVDWTRDNTALVTGIAASGSGNITGSLTNTTNAPITVTFNFTVNGCPTNPSSASVIVTPSTVPTFDSIAPIAVCSSSPLPSISNNGITGTWSPAFNSLTTTTYTFTPDAGQCATTTTLTVTIVGTPPGNPLVYGNNEWNVYAWNSGGNFSSDNPWITNYSGYYTASGVNFNTQNQWSNSPSEAPGYQGCPVNVDFHSWSAKRQGFPTNYYSIDVNGHDDSSELFINGVMVWNHQGCCDFHGGVWQGFLSASDQVEFRTTEGVGGSNGQLSFNVVVPTITASGVTTFCSGGNVVLTSSPTLGTGYLWSNGATTQSITVTTSGNYSVQYTGASFTSDASLPITVTVNPNPVISIAGSSSICAGDSVTLTASGADNYSWNGIFSPTTIPLDLVSNAKLAIGIRKLKTTYTGPCVRLRRDSDNAESDFGFNGNDIDSSAITTWLNGATGYCVTLYDQSGNGGDVSQLNTFNQPTLTLNGYNGKPVLHFNTQQLLLNNVVYPSSYTAIYGARQTGGTRGRVLSAPNNNWLLGYWNGAKQQAYYAGWVSSNPGNPASDDNYYIYSGASDGSTSQLYENGALIENNSGGVASPIGIELNGWAGGYELSDCDFTDVFVFDTVLNTTDRNTVENSTKNYYVPISTPSITVSPTVTTTYTVIGTNITGCSATESITVTVNPVTSNTSTISACNSYLWTVNGTTYTTSGTYTSVVNCNTETLILTINNSTTNGSLTTSASGSYTWAGPLGSGLTYTTSGIYTFTTTNAAGCPNVATLNLTITSVATVNTFVIGTSCGSTITNLAVTIIAPYVSGATVYTFRLKNLTTNAVQLINRPVNSFALSNVAGVTLGTPYQVEVSVNNGPFGSPCTVITPAPVATIGTQCGTNLTAMSQWVYATYHPTVTGYRFKVTNTTNNTVQVYDAGLNRFNFNQLSNRAYGTTYFVEVALRNTDGTYLPYSTGCNITTPVFPSSEIRLSQCDYTAISNTENIVAVVVSGATEYRFNISNTILGYNVTIDRPLNSFNLNMFSGLLAGTTYSVQVAVKIGGVFGPYGKICNLTTPGGTRLVSNNIKVENEFKALLYPNPFAESFKLDVKTLSESTIQIRVYDMLGKLIENKNVIPSEIQNLELGTNYSSGVYNLIVSQGENTQTLRVIKR